jgi:hypothetical protein
MQWVPGYHIFTHNDDEHFACLIRKEQILMNTMLCHQHKYILLPYATPRSFVLAGIASFEISFFFSFSRSFLLTFFSRLRLVRFSRSVSACAVIAAYFLRMAIRRFLPARVRRVLVLVVVEAKRVGRRLDDDDGLLVLRCMTRHGSAVPGFEPRRMMSAPIIPMTLYYIKGVQLEEYTHPFRPACAL